MNVKMNSLAFSRATLGIPSKGGTCIFDHIKNRKIRTTPLSTRSLMDRIRFQEAIPPKVVKVVCNSKLKKLPAKLWISSSSLRPSCSHRKCPKCSMYFSDLGTVLPRFISAYRDWYR